MQEIFYATDSRYQADTTELSLVSRYLVSLVNMRNVYIGIEMVDIWK